MKAKTHTANLELARRIRAAGFLIHVPEDDPDGTLTQLHGVFIRQQGGVSESLAFDLGAGAGFLLSLVITVNIPAFAISAFDLEVPWDGAVRFLEDPSQVDGSSDVYNFGERGRLEFHRNEVLNHYADVRRILPRGSSISGLLLAICDRCIPEEFRHGTCIPAFVTVYDQYQNKYRSPISLWSDRSSNLRSAAKPKVKRKGLFECPDPRPQNESSSCDPEANRGVSLTAPEGRRD